MGMFGEIGNQMSDQIGADSEIGMTLIGRALAQGDIDKANALYQQILQQAQGVQNPTFQNYTPQTVDAQNGVPLAGQGRSAQVNAIQNLQSFVDQNGLDAQGRAANQQVMGQQAQANQGQQGAIMNQMARQGMSGSGSELAAMLSGQQGSANAARSNGLDIAGQARSRALAALGQQAGVAGQMRGQDIGVQQGNQSAEQARQMFNAKQRMAAMQGNNQNSQMAFNDNLNRLQNLGQAEQGSASRYDQGAKQTMGDFASIGRANNYKSQMAGQGFEDTFPY
jgi:hypothetical protein